MNICVKIERVRDGQLIGRADLRIIVLWCNSLVSIVYNNYAI